MSAPLSVIVGARVRCRDHEYVITHVTDLSSVLARRVTDGRMEQLRLMDLRPCSTEEPATPDIELHGISDAAWKAAEARFGAIEPLTRTPHHLRTRDMAESAANAAGVHWTTIYRWLSEYETTGLMSSLLLPGSRGGRGRGRLDDTAENIMSAMIREHYLSSQKKTVRTTILQVQAASRAAGIRPPSARTVYRRIGQLTAETTMAAREGKKAAEQRYGSRPGKLQIESPLALAQIDHTLLDIMVVDDVGRLPLGRPWITVIIDVFSRMVLGFYVALDPPGAMGTGLAIAHAVLPKERWLLEREIETPWPCWGFPAKLAADNAREFRGNTLRRACQEYGCGLEFRPVGVPHYGGHIESLMGTIGAEIHALPGTTFSNPAQRGEYDSEAKAVFTLGELEAWLARWISEVYHRRAHRGLGGRTPLGVFEEAVLRTGMPPRITNVERLRIDFTPYFTRTVQDDGVVIEHVYYNDGVLRGFVGARDPDEPTRALKLRCHRDPRDISSIHYFDPKQGRYVRVPYKHIGRPALSVWELREARKALVTAGRAEIDEEALFAAYDRLRAQQQEAERRTKRARRDHQRKQHLATAKPPTSTTKQSDDGVAGHSIPAAEGDIAPREVAPYDDHDPLEDLSWIDETP